MTVSQAKTLVNNTTASVSTGAVSYVLISQSTTSLYCGETATTYIAREVYDPFISRASAQMTVHNGTLSISCLVDTFSYRAASRNIYAATFIFSVMYNFSSGVYTLVSAGCGYSQYTQTLTFYVDTVRPALDVIADSASIISGGTRVVNFKINDGV